MKLEPKAKPVRIRIKSGGEEHFNLESLKQNFSVQDLWEAVKGKSLSRWLKQQNETDLAEQVEAFCQIEEPSVEDYIKFSSLFFEKEMKGVPNDSNALVRFYQDNNLMNNFRNAFSFFLNSMDYEEGKAWFDSFRRLKNDDDWIEFFTAKLSQLEELDKQECYGILSELYKDKKDEKNMEICLAEERKIIVGLIKKDKRLAEKWIASNDFYCIKTVFENEVVKGTRSTKEWITIFDNCKSLLSKADLAECYYILCSLYEETGDGKKAEEYLKQSSNLGNGKAKQKIMREKVNPIYPELTRILNRYRNGRRIIWDDIPEINKELSANIKKDYYFKVCYSCVVMFKKTIEDTFTDSRVGFENLLDRRELLFKSFGQSYELLVVLIAGLAWEEKTQDTDYYDEEYFIEKYRNKFYELKRANKKAVIAASSGMECNLKKDSIIEQMFFCMETYGEEYSIVG